MATKNGGQGQRNDALSTALRTRALSGVTSTISSRSIRSMASEALLDGGTLRYGRSVNPSESVPTTVPRWSSYRPGVEGHNGFLSLRCHHRRALPPALLKALMVIHNYVLRREDGTTAAQRFFAARHDDLFEHLVEVIAPLPRPRRRHA